MGVDVDEARHNEDAGAVHGLVGRPRIGRTHERNGVADEDDVDVAAIDV